MEANLPSDGCIHGHPVCVLHCRSDALTKWKTINDKDAEILRLRNELANLQ